MHLRIYYSLYKRNGLKIQWGRSDNTGSSGNDKIVKITFPLKPFTQIPSVCCTNCFSAVDHNSWFPDIQSIDVNGFTYNTRLNKTSTMMNWIAIGY